MTLTPAQKRLVQKLRQATRIRRGVIWYAEYPERKYSTFVALDGRICNALERKGVLVYDEDTDAYNLRIQ